MLALEEHDEALVEIVRIRLDHCLIWNRDFDVWVCDHMCRFVFYALYDISPNTLCLVNSCYIQIPFVGIIL
jgi:hypothetical protein